MDSQKLDIEAAQLSSTASIGASTSATPPPPPPPSTIVFKPASQSTVLDDLPDSELEPTASEVKAAYAAATGRLAANQVLRTSAMRAKDEKAKPKPAWENTNIRVKFSDRTQIERSFPSSSNMVPVYAFVRASLSPEHQSEAFTLYQPPRTIIPEIPPKAPAKKMGGPYARARTPPPIPITLAQHGLAPSSMLMIRFDNDALNSGDRPAPLLTSLLSHATDLPMPTAATQAAPAKIVEPTAAAMEKPKGGGGKMPKWFKGSGKK